MVNCSGRCGGGDVEVMFSNPLLALPPEQYQCFATELLIQITVTFACKRWLQVSLACTNVLFLMEVNCHAAFLFRCFFFLKEGFQLIESREFSILIKIRIGLQGIRGKYSKRQGEDT